MTKWIGQNVTLNRNVTFKEKLHEDILLSIKYLNQTHLDIVMSEMRDKKWSHKDERKFTIALYKVLIIFGLRRQQINSIMKLTGICLKLNLNTLLNLFVDYMFI